MLFVPLALASTLLALLLHPAPAAANTEKAIFVAPPALPIPLARPSLADLRLAVLTPHNASTAQLRTALARAAPQAKQSETHGPQTVETWMLLDELTAGQRYEVRVCWAATDPTDFTLDAYDLTTVFETPALITSLATYANNQPSTAVLAPPSAAERTASVILLRIAAAASYVSSQPQPQSAAPAVSVDVILDPFVAYGLLPRSLVPAVAYVLAGVPVAWLLARALAAWVAHCAAAGPEERAKKVQ
ncbi:hypothetical protein BROUX41_006753 [Berkeleyomyces rouxiae]|uniref:uncharacterized protein n=1 Tax=Berkeleyomyces rouxiae TaxID=2035830 RepID=UPI003B7D3FE1